MNTEPATKDPGGSALPIDPETVKMLLGRAQAAAARAYAPYSGFHIGAALLTAANNVYTGCNVENASYGLTWCAERTAVVGAVAAEGGQHMHIRVVAVWTKDLDTYPPCGACRQVLAEFGPDAVVIYSANDMLKQRSVAELLPDSFLLDNR